MGRQILFFCTEIFAYILHKLYVMFMLWNDLFYDYSIIMIFNMNTVFAVFLYDLSVAVIFVYDLSVVVIVNFAVDTAGKYNFRLF